MATIKIEPKEEQRASVATIRMEPQDEEQATLKMPPQDEQATVVTKREPREAQAAVVPMTFEQCMKKFLPTEDLPELLYSLPSREKRVTAANLAMEATRAELEKQARQTQQYSDSDDSDASMDAYNDRSHYKSEPSDALENHQKRFLEALPDCPMIIGFHVRLTHVKLDECCWCPCGPKFGRWREHFDVGVATCKDPHNFAPNALVDHLEVKSTRNPRNVTFQPCLYHWMVLSYLKFLYTDFWPDAGMMHKAFYKALSPNHERAKAEETKEQLRITAHLVKALEMERATNEELQVKLKEAEEALKVSPDLKILHQRHENRDKLLKTFGVSEEAKKARESPLSLKSANKYEALFRKTQEYWRMALPVEKKAKVIICVESNFDLSQCFAEWYKKSNNDPTCLFHSIDKHTAGKLVKERWNVKFAGHAGLRQTKKQKKEDGAQAVDEGGPSEEFLTQVWKTLCNLTVGNAGESGYHKPLFTEVGEYLVPEVNISWESAENCQIIDAYYVAIGRIIGSCVARRIPIAANVMPMLYRNYLLRNLDPRNSDEYPIQDLVFDLFEMIKSPYVEADSLDAFMVKFLELSADDEDEKVEIETRFRNFVYKQYIQDRSRAFTFLSEGIKLSDCFDPTILFAAMPWQAVNHLLFCRMDIEVEDVVRALEPVYDDGALPVDKKNQRKVLTKQGETTGILPELLSKDKEFLHAFFWFATARETVPLSSFVIKFEFNSTDNYFQSPDSLPMAHTCVKTVKVPSTAYDGDARLFRTKLMDSFNWAKHYKFDQQ